MRRLHSRDDTGPISRTRIASHAAIRGKLEFGVLTALAGPTAGMLYPIDHGTTVIGRGGESQILIAATDLSQRHAAIECDGGNFFLEDLGSTNGTTVDGTRVDGRVMLADGSRIALGRSTILGFGRGDAIEQAAARHAHDLAMRDSLTGLYNRRYLNERLQSEVAYARRHRCAISVLLIDVDRFKRVNDTYGHAVGDHVLRVMAEQLKLVIRCEDVVARVGGEEFVVVARGIDGGGAAVLGDRIRRAIAEGAVPTANVPLQVTVSVGVAHAAGGVAASPDQLLRFADTALYRAKDQGRDRVEFHRVPSADTTYRARNAGRDRVNLRRMAAAPPTLREMPAVIEIDD